jgi:hypothetical protein
LKIIFYYIKYFFLFIGHSVVEISTKDFFIWLQQAEPEGEEEES